MAIWCMRIALSIPEATFTHSEYVIYYLLLFHCDNFCTNVPQCYVIRALPLKFNFTGVPSLKLQFFLKKNYHFVTDNLSVVLDLSESP
jgi:hypothetical protein